MSSARFYMLFLQASNFPPSCVESGHCKSYTQRLIFLINQSQHQPRDKLMPCPRFDYQTREGREYSIKNIQAWLQQENLSAAKKEILNSIITCVMDEDANTRWPFTSSMTKHFKTCANIFLQTHLPDLFFVKFAKNEVLMGKTFKNPLQQQVLPSIIKIMNALSLQHVAQTRKAALGLFCLALTMRCIGLLDNSIAGWLLISGLAGVYGAEKLTEYRVNRVLQNYLQTVTAATLSMPQIPEPLTNDLNDFVQNLVDYTHTRGQQIYHLLFARPLPPIDHGRDGLVRAYAEPVSVLNPR